MGPDSRRGGRAGESKKRNNVMTPEVCRRLPAGTSRRQQIEPPSTSPLRFRRIPYTVTRQKETNDALHREDHAWQDAELKRLCDEDEDDDDATTINAVIASIKAFFPHLMVPQDAVEKVEGFIKQLAADQVLVIVRGGGLCLM